VIGVREGGAQAMRFDVVRVPAEQSLGDYLNSGWMESVDKASTEDLSINGFPAASAQARGDQWQFKVYALRFGSDVYRFIFATKEKTTESDRNARETVNSSADCRWRKFRRRDRCESKIITRKPGDTVESLSHAWPGRPGRRSAFASSTAPFDAHAQSKVRDLVKIVWIDAKRHSGARVSATRIPRFQAPSFRDAPLAARPGIHNHRRWLWIPGLRRTAAARNDGAWNLGIPVRADARPGMTASRQSNHDLSRDPHLDLGVASRPLRTAKALRRPVDRGQAVRQRFNRYRRLRGDDLIRSGRAA